MSYIGWSRRGYSKPRPPRYECGAPSPPRTTARAACATALELLRHGASAENRTPLIGQAIRCPTNRPRPRNDGADGDNRNLFSGLEAQGTPYIPRPLKHLVSDRYSVVKDQRRRYTSSVSLPMGSGLVIALISPHKTKGAATFGGRPFLKTSTLSQDVVRSPRARHDSYAPAYL